MRPTGRMPFGLVIQALSLCGFCFTAPAVQATARQADLCVEAARKVASESDIPFDVLLALTLTETGRNLEGELSPWPWTLNEAGAGRWFSSKREVLTYLENSRFSADANVDIGCFQLNLRWHGAAFSSFEEMLDPLKNARYAAEYLKGFYHQSGDWRLAAGAYHSGTAEYAKIYLARFDPIRAALSDMPEASSRGPNGYPLLQAGASGNLGSLVPLQSGGRPLFGGS